MTDFLANGCCFVVVGVSHRQAPIALLERLALDPDRLELANRDLQRRAGVLSGFLLATCNRLEMYVLGDSAEVAQSALACFLHWCGPAADDVAAYVYRHVNGAALKHLFMVSASLDSLVPGEAQILGQVKESYDAMAARQASHPVMDRLMRKAISVAKRVRSETAVANQAVSVAYAAVELARRIFADLPNCKVLMLGAGEMAELALQHLIGRGIGEAIVCNRSFDNAAQLAQRFKATAIPQEAMNEYLKSVDIVIASTAARQPIILQKTVRQLMPERTNRPLFFIDIAMPRNIEPTVNDIDNVYLYNMEDLKRVVEENLAQRRDEMRKAELLVDSEAAQFVAELRRRRHDQLLAQLHTLFGGIVSQELQRTVDKAAAAGAELSAAQLEALQRMQESLLTTLLHRPAQFLRRRDHDTEALERAVDAARSLFGINEEASAGKEEDAKEEDAPVSHRQSR